MWIIHVVHLDPPVRAFQNSFIFISENGPDRWSKLRMTRSLLNKSDRNCQSHHPTFSCSSAWKVCMAFNKVSGPAAATLFQRDAQSRGQVQRSFTPTFFEKMGWRAEYSAFLRRTQKRFSFFFSRSSGQLNQQISTSASSREFLQNSAESCNEFANDKKERNFWKN